MPNGQRWLIIETSGRAAAVALADGGAVEARPLPEGRRHARDLAARTRELLDARGLRARDLDGVIVSQGPGSYTGLRVGVMSAKALAYATGCRLVAVETFRAIARQAPPGATAVDVLADAQQGRVYAQPFRRPAPLAPWEPA
ncbi:MAG TPA: tRNA (adenosine(37)-N6)-threonylcarbamoyltransferase complex dimerization subunit type 1 TsaB, partial [Gemmataceae bacterium]